MRDRSGACARMHKRFIRSALPSPGQAFQDVSSALVQRNTALRGCRMKVTLQVVSVAPHLVTRGGQVTHPIASRLKLLNLEIRAFVMQVSVFSSDLLGLHTDGRTASQVLRYGEQCHSL